jgi:oligopeptide transport system permease protein
MPRFVLRRLLESLPVLWAVVTITFFLIRLAPGGPFSDERSYPRESMEQLARHYGLDQPVGIQYVKFLGNLARGRLGPSFKYPNRTVNEIVAEAFPVSAELGLLALLFALALGVTAGVVAALKPNSALDHAVMAVSLGGICVPSFVLASLLVLGFALRLGWVNASGWETAGDRVLPAITLGAAYAAYLARLSRAGMLEVLPKDFVRTARAKGLPEWRVVLAHALKPGLLPVVSFLGPAAAGLLTGSFVVETVFQVPGLGRMFVAGALNRDYSLVLGLVAFYAVVLVAFNTLVDVCLAWLDPRIRLGQ